MRGNRIWLMAAAAVVIIGICWIIGSAGNKKPSVLQPTNSKAQTQNAQQAGSTSVVPWDYKLVEAKVGDLVGNEMVILPDNTMLKNDQNFATGDTIEILSFMSAEMITDSSGRNDIKLSPWQPIKTFKTKAEADKDITDLKKEIKTDVDLVGVYKTENEGQFRYFAVVTMPTGQKVKQPIPEDRYISFKSLKQVPVVLEEVHDFNNYDQTMAKFRGWAQ
ncbi:hypothetical protein [Paenibacillus sp. GP183]|uniref:hypothetical protein n=1 Tax=Paenibacillus sp. GP183 TaxID=1882751 RepID=UPI00089B9437|nr:hypothetical protein [Paenibacillus sp. GP183]SEB90505.1 hypothetical protein SAMN05443246_2306 [Paenibacillus sp. GP183]